MVKNKRPRENEAVVDLDDVHPLRKKRIKYTKEDAQLANTYNELADEVQSVRIKAAGDLLKQLSKKGPDQAQHLDVAETRLIRGLCSGRKAARLGFSIALTELFRLKFAIKPGAESTITLFPVLDNIVNLTSTEGNVSGQEKRDHALGRRFAFQAILQSDVGLSQSLSDEEWQRLMQAVFDLASQKQWLRRECGVMLHEYLTSPKGSELRSGRVLILVDQLISYKLAKTSEGVGLWITVQQRFPDVKLPKGIWHHRDPLSSKERSVLAKVLLETGLDDEPSTKKPGSRQAAPGFVWTVILSLFAEGKKEGFAKFWESAVVSTMFSSSASTERKALGLQVLTLAISLASRAMLMVVLANSNPFRCILDQRGNSERYLFDAAKAPLNQILARTKQDSYLASDSIQVLIDNCGPNFDQLSKTKTIETIINQTHADDLDSIVCAIADRIANRGDADQSRADNERRILADMLLNTLRSHRRAEELFQGSSEDERQTNLLGWVEKLLTSLVSYGYGLQSLANPLITDGSQAMFRGRVMSCLTCLLDHKIERAVVAPRFVVNKIAELYMWKNGAQERHDTIARAQQLADNAGEKSTKDGTMIAFQLLFYLSIIQAYNDEPDSLAALEDLITCYQSRGESEDSATMLIELMLSFVSKSSALFRKLAEQVFSAFAPQLTAESLHSLIDVLEQKESLTGQRALFDDPEQHAGSAEVEEEIDVEDASDLELTNGYVVEASPSDQGGDSNSSSDSSSEAEEASTVGEDEELAAFDKKLADALGTNGVGDDSDDDGSDMDDEQMMALEPHLESIFKERQKGSTKKQDKKDAKENIVNFKNRVLDLLTIYVKNQHSNVLAMDLILPLTTLIRTTTSKPTAEKAFGVLKQYFETCNKNKSFPQPNDQEACFEVLAAVQSEMTTAGSNLHTNACSRSSLFLSKVLVSLDQENFRRIAYSYAELQIRWYLNPKLKKSLATVFNEWANWSSSTRKQE